MRTHRASKDSLLLVVLILSLVVVATYAAWSPPRPQHEAPEEGEMHTPQLPRLEAHKAAPVAKEDGMANYWHCIGTSTPGVAPPDDPDNWEPVDPPDGIEDGETVFGCGEDLGSWDYAGDLRGTVFPFPTGDPTTSVESADGTPLSYPSSVSFSEVADTLYAITCVYDATTNIPTSIRVYGNHPEGVEGDPINIRAAIYTSGGSLVMASELLAIGPGVADWHELEIVDGSPLTEGANYVLVCWSENNADGFPMHFRHGVLPDYTPPDGHQWDPDEEYEYCQTVRYDPEYDILSWSPTAVYDLADIVSYEPVWLEWNDSTQYKWCNFVHYRPD